MPGDATLNDTAAVRITDSTETSIVPIHADGGLTAHVANLGAAISAAVLKTGGSGLLGWLSQLVLGAEYFRKQQITLNGYVKTAQKQTLMSFSARRPLSVVRFALPIANGGTIAQANGGEYAIATAATANGSAQLETLRRGAYVCGLPAILELSMRIPTAPVNDQDIHWGYYNAQDGWRFGYDATGMYVAHRLNGAAETKVYQTAWNVDKGDGTGASGVTLAPANGVIYFIEFLWFGYGPVEFGVYLPGEDGQLHRIVLHRYQTTGQLNSATPFLPMAMGVTNGAAGGAITAYVGGGAFSVQGQYAPPRRTRGTIREFSLANSAAEQHIFTIRHKTGAGFEAAYMPFQALEALVAGADQWLIIRFNATLTGGTWAPPYGVPATETVAEVSQDVAVTAGTGTVELIMPFAVLGRSDAGDRRFDNIYVPPGSSLSVMTLSLNPGNGQTCSLSARWFEEW